jgi:hypothetical protein
VQPSYAVRVDASKVCTSEHIGSLLRIFLRTSEVKKYAGAEIA